MPRRRGGAGGRLAALGISLLIALLMCEALIRGIGAARPDWAFSRYVNELKLALDGGSIYRTSDDPVLAYELVPSVERGAVRVNRRGFRGAEIDASPAPGVHRVAVIGDSETFGALLLEHETFAAQLERALEQRSGADYEVMNFGVPGYNSQQELRVLEERALPLKPQDVVLLYVFNDPIVESVVSFPDLSWRDRSRLLTFLKWFLKSNAPGLNPELQGHRRGDKADFYRDLHEGESFAPVAETVRAMARAATGAGARFWLVILPEVKYFDDFAEYPFDSVHARLHALASQEISVVDPLAALSAAGRSPLSFWVIPTDNHKNGDAHAIMAGVAAEQMRAADSAEAAGP